MAAILTRETHKIAIELHVVAESFTICNSRSRRPVRKPLDTVSLICLSPTINATKNEIYVTLHNFSLEFWPTFHFSLIINIVPVTFEDIVILKITLNVQRS